jgi:hypothetical protein
VRLGRVDALRYRGLRHRRAEAAADRAARSLGV